MATDQLQSAAGISPAFPKPTSSGTRIVLHVGCGPADSQSLHQSFRGPEWREIRVDLDPDVKPDLVASITDMQTDRRRFRRCRLVLAQPGALERPRGACGVGRILSRPRSRRRGSDHAARPAAGRRIHRRRQAGRGCLRVSASGPSCRLIAFSGLGRAIAAGRSSAHGAPHGIHGEDPPQAPRTGRLCATCGFGFLPLHFGPKRTKPGAEISGAECPLRWQSRFHPSQVRTPIESEGGSFLPVPSPGRNRLGHWKPQRAASFHLARHI